MASKLCSKLHYNWSYKMKLLKSLPIAVITFSSMMLTNISTTSAAERCDSLLLSMTNESPVNHLKLKLSPELSSEFEQLLSSDPGLVEIMNQPGVLEFLTAVAQKKDLKSIRPLLFKIWQNPETQDLSLNRLTGVKITAQDNTSKLLKILETVETAQSEKSKTQSVKEKSYEILKRVSVQLKNFMTSLKRSKQLINTEMHPAVLDNYLFDFYGYLNLKIEGSRMRKWETPPGSMAGIKLSDVQNIDPMTFTNVLMLASQIEAPVDQYSDASGHIFHLYPQGARFMGKTHEQAEAHRMMGKKLYCTNSWCFEENRHEGMLENVARSILGFLPPNSHPFGADFSLSPFNPDNVLFHILSRANNELAASSAYFLLGSHSQGNTYAYLKNIRNDELKHSTVFAGLYKYQRGNTYWSRLKGVLKKTMIEFFDKSDNSEYSSVFSREPLTILEALYAQVQYEKSIKTYIESLPLKTLRKIYETEINLNPLPEVDMDPVKQRQVELLSKLEKSRRESLAMWDKKQKNQAYQLEYFEANNNEAISRLIKTELRSFVGAEDFGNLKDTTNLAFIESLRSENLTQYFNRELTKTEIKLLKESLKQTMRDYQIMNNSSVRTMGLSVRFVDAAYGFEIVKDGKYDAVPKVKE